MQRSNNKLMHENFNDPIEKLENFDLTELIVLEPADSKKLNQNIDNDEENDSNISIEADDLKEWLGEISESRLYSPLDESNKEYLENRLLSTTTNTNSTSQDRQQ